MRAIVERHVAACLAELRAAVEAEIREAIAGLSAGVREKPSARPVQRAKRVKRTTAGRSRKSQAAAPRAKPQERAWHPTRNQRPCGCAPRGRHKKGCAGEQPPQPVERLPSADSPRIAPVVDETRAQRFARIEAAAAKRREFV